VLMWCETRAALQFLVLLIMTTTIMRSGSNGKTF